MRGAPGGTSASFAATAASGVYLVARLVDISRVADPVRVAPGPDQSVPAALQGPFDRQGLARRVLPFAVVAVLAAASLALPPGPKSPVDGLAAVGLLAVAGVALLLPWARVPASLSLLVPLTCTLSVLMMVMSARGPSSGVGIVVLAPLIWTALYHRRWESAVVVAAIVAIEVVTSLTPVVEPGATIVRRVVFWALLGALLSVATHDLRDRVRRHVAARDEALRQTIALQAAAEELTATLDPEDVISRATRLAAELVSPSGTPGRRAQYGRVDQGMVTLAAQYDETGDLIAEEFPLADHPYLRQVLEAGRALSVRFDAGATGPSVRDIIERLGVTHGVYVPVVLDGQVDGVLWVSVRGVEVTPELFEQCKALGHLLELALANAITLRKANEEAFTDALTNLPNRRGFEAFIANRPGRRPFVILALDVDGLKQVNDSRGHSAGDALLVQVADLVRQTMRRGDVLARLGGDEFAAYLFDADESDGCRVAERMIDSLSPGDETLTASVSIGVAVGAAGDDADKVYAAADAAMYRAKRAGGMRYQTALSRVLPGPRLWRP
jgi:diguanylate cyclase (GGDEF)-like protein